MSITKEIKMFAILNLDNIVVDAWIASSLDEAKKDNKGKKVIEMTLENTPAYGGAYWDGIKFIAKEQNE